MTVTAIRLPDGTDLDAASAVCEGCGEAMTDHRCGGAAGATTSVTYSRSTGPRKPPSAHPTCPHCGGRVHFNMGGTAINAECLNRQYSLDTGLMTDPNGRLPVMTLETMRDIVAWAESLSTKPSYGKMVSASGGAATYSGLRPKTGRKKKAVAAAPGSQIQDLADEEEITAEAPATGKAKSKRGRKPKVSKLTVGEGVATAESVDLEEAVAEASNGHEVVEAELQSEVAPEPSVSDDEAAREARRLRRQKRKELLKAGGR